MRLSWVSSASSSSSLPAEALVEGLERQLAALGHLRDGERRAPGLVRQVSGGRDQAIRARLEVRLGERHSPNVYRIEFPFRKHLESNTCSLCSMTSKKPSPRRLRRSSGSIRCSCAASPSRSNFLKVRALGRFDESGDWAAEGFVSAAAWLRARTNMSHGAAVQALTLARRLPQLPETAAAFAAGEISRQHASLIADACTPERMQPIAEVEAHLVEIARRVQPRELRTVVRRLTDALDGDGGAATDDELYERRRLHLSPTLGGMGVLDGALDAEGTEIVATALDAEMERDLLRADTRSRAATARRRAREHLPARARRRRARQFAPRPPALLGGRRHRRVRGPRSRPGRRGSARGGARRSPVTSDAGTAVVRLRHQPRDHRRSLRRSST